MKEKIFIVGSGQHANVVLYNIRAQGKYEVAGILDSEITRVGQTVHGIKVVGTYDKLDEIYEKYKVKNFFIAFGDMRYRKQVFELFISNGWEAVNIVHPQAVIAPNAKIGAGVLIECGCLITPNPTIGNNVVINTGSQVNHDNFVGSHAYIASGVVLSGGVRIEENTLIDDGVIVTLGKTVGKNCIIGAGSVVTKNIPDNVVAFGVPAKVIRRQDYPKL